MLALTYVQSFSSNQKFQHSLGVIEEETASSDGVASIMGVLQMKVKATKDRPVVCYGDGLSIQRMIQAKDLRYQDLDPKERLDGLVPGVQEMHKHGILLQV